MSVDTGNLGKDRAARLAKLKTAKGRAEQRLLLLDSLPVIGRALDLGLCVELIHEHGRCDDLVERARKGLVKTTVADARILGRIADVETSAGAVGIARAPDPVAADVLIAASVRFGVFLEDLADPGNVGAIARSAAAFGCDVLLYGGRTADPFAPKTLRASAGALLDLPSACIELDELARSSRTPRVARAVVRGGVPLEEAAFEPGDVVWLGSEAHGAGQPPRGLRTWDVRIPISAKTESLNVAAAAAILFHELDRRLGRP